MTATATLTLPQWLEREIAADEAAAQAALQPQRVTWATTANTAASVAGPDAGLFILFHDPARVLRQCAAFRAIVALHDEYLLGSTTYCGSCGDVPQIDYPCPTLRALAQVYADRDGFQEAWA